MECTCPTNNHALAQNPTPRASHAFLAAALKIFFMLVGTAALMKASASSQRLRGMRAASARLHAVQDATPHHVAKLVHTREHIVGQHRGMS